MPSEACGLVESVERAIAAGRNFVALVGFWSMYTQSVLKLLLSFGYRPWEGNRTKER